MEVTSSESKALIKKLERTKKKYTSQKCFDILFEIIKNPIQNELNKKPNPCNAISQYTDILYKIFSIDNTESIEIYKKIISNQKYSLYTQNTIQAPTIFDQIFHLFYPVSENRKPDAIQYPIDMNISHIGIFELYDIREVIIDDIPQSEKTCKGIIVFYPYDAKNMGMMIISFDTFEFRKEKISIDIFILLMFYLLGYMDETDSNVRKFISPFISDKINYIEFVFGNIDYLCFNDFMLQTFPNEIKSSNYDKQKFIKFLDFLEIYAGYHLNDWVYIITGEGNVPQLCSLTRDPKRKTKQEATLSPCSSQCGQTANLFRYIFYDDDFKQQLKEAKTLDTKNLNITQINNIIEKEIIPLLKQGYYLEISVPSELTYSNYCGHIFSVFYLDGVFYWIESYIFNYPLRIYGYDTEKDFTKQLNRFINIFTTSKWTNDDIQMLNKLFPTYTEILKNLGGKLNPKLDSDKIQFVSFNLYNKPDINNVYNNFEKLFPDVLNIQQRKRLNDIIIQTTETNTEQFIAQNIFQIICAFYLLFYLDEPIDIVKRDILPQFCNSFLETDNKVKTKINNMNNIYQEALRLIRKQS